MIDPELYHRLKKEKLSSVISVSEIIKKELAFESQRTQYLTKYRKYLSQTKHTYNRYQHIETADSFAHEKPRASDIAFAQKKFCLTLVKCNTIIESIEYKTGNTSEELKQKLIEYHQNKNKENLIKLAIQSYKSYNPVIGYEQHRFGLNAKAIQKKVDVDVMEQKIESIKKQLESYSFKNWEEILNKNTYKYQKDIATEQYDLYVKIFDGYVKYGNKRISQTWYNIPEWIIQKDEKRKLLIDSQEDIDQEQGNNKEELKKQYKIYKNWKYEFNNLFYQSIFPNIKSDYIGLLRTYNIQDLSKLINQQANNIECVRNKTNWSTKYQIEWWITQLCRLHFIKTRRNVIYWQKRWEFLALNQELINQQQLTHFARLVKQGESYFVVMIDRDHIAQLDTFPTLATSDTQILAYNSLTAKAVGKLLFDNNALRIFKDKNLDFDEQFEEYKHIKTIRETKSYKEKWSEDPQAKTDDQKNNLHQLVKWMNDKIQILNTTLEWWVFNRKPFVIDQDFDTLQVFLDYITKSCYHCVWKWVNRDMITQRDKEWKIDIYQLYNKDFAVHSYCAITERDKRSLTSDKKIGKPNLFTIYRDNRYKDTTGQNIRLNPASKLYIRPAKEGKDIDDYNKSKDLSKERFRTNKLIGDFQLIFYPTVHHPSDQLQKIMTDAIKGNHAIGIDLGENSLAMLCLVDGAWNVVIENNKPVIADLTMINSKWEFIEETDCLIGSQTYKRKNKLLIDKEIDWWKAYFLSDRFSNDAKKIPLKNMTLEQLQQAYTELEKLDPKYLTITDRQGNKVFDYAYAFEYLRTLNKIKYHIQSFNKSDDEKTLIETELMDSTRIRNGYTSKVVSYITLLAQQYNAMIVFENLDQQWNASGTTLFAEKAFSGVSWKDFRHLKWLSPYQLIQNAIIRKCNYLLTKESVDASFQTTPRLRKLQDIKDLTQIKWQKDCGWGTVVFVNEDNTSKECPACTFSLVKMWQRDIDLQKRTAKYKFWWQWKYVELDLQKEPFIERKWIIDYLIKNESDLKLIEKSWDKRGEELLKNLRSWIFATRIKYADPLEWKLRKTQDHMVCIHCGYDTRKQEWIDTYNLKSCDEIAAYIVAKRWQKFLQSGNGLWQIKSDVLIAHSDKENKHDIQKTIQNDQTDQTIKSKILRS